MSIFLYAIFSVCPGPIFVKNAFIFPKDDVSDVPGNLYGFSARHKRGVAIHKYFKVFVTFRKFLELDIKTAQKMPQYFKGI